MWYYSMNNQPVGPVDSETIRSLLQSGKIDVNTLVWQEGMADWKRLGETVFAAPVSQPVPTYAPAQSAQPVQPAPAYSTYPVGSTTPPPFYSTVKASTLKNLYIWFVILFSLSTIASLFTSMITDTDAMTSFTCVVGVLALGGGVLFLLQMYNYWKMIQDGYASTTPGKAIGFLFIPLYNLYWAFQTFWGLSKNLNSFIDRHFSAIPGMQVRRAMPTISLVFCIVYLVNMALTGVTTMMSLNGDSLYGPGSGMSTFVSIFSLIFAGLEIATFTDFYLTSKSILENLR